MKRFRVALSAFMAIITEKPHIYCSVANKDYFTYSADCTNTQFNTMMQHLNNWAVEEYNQQLCVEEAKKILEQKDNQE